MQKKLYLYLVLFILMLLIPLSCQHGPTPPRPSSSTADQFSSDVAKLMEELLAMMEWGEQPVTVGLGSFFYGNSRMSSDFAYHFASEVENVVINMPQLTLVSRSRLDEILNELGFQLSDLVDQKTAKSTGKIKGLDAMLTGRYSIWEGKVRVKAELIRIEDAEMVVATRLIYSVPDDVAVKPPNYEVQKQRIEERVQDWLASGDSADEQVSSSDFSVTIEPDRTEAYREGDKLRLYVKSEIDCYIEIYNILQDGSTYLIFPNENWLKVHSPDDNFILAGVRTIIPPDSSFDLEISAPYGIETLKVIASTEPFTAYDRSLYQTRGAFPSMGDIDDARALESLKYRTRSVIAKSSSSGGKARVAESYCTILTKPLSSPIGK